MDRALRIKTECVSQNRVYATMFEILLHSGKEAKMNQNKKSSKNTTKTSDKRGPEVDVA